MGSNDSPKQSSVRRRRRQPKPENPLLESTRSSPSSKGKLSAREYSTNRISQKQKKEQQTREIERLLRPTKPTRSPGPVGPVTMTTGLSTGIPDFLATDTDTSLVHTTNSTADSNMLGTKNERKAVRTRFPIIAGPGERQRFITTFLDGRINDGMISVEKASIRAQELSQVVSPSGSTRLHVVEEVVSVLTCFTKDEDTLSCAYLIDLVRFDKLSLDNTHNEFGARTGGMIEQILMMENQPKLFTTQMELLAHPLHLQPVEPWVMVVLSFVLVEMFQQECIQLEWVEQVVLALGHHQGLLSQFSTEDLNSPEAVVVGMLLLGSDVVQENVAFRGWHMADMEDVLKRMQIRRLPCCDGLVQHGLKALVSAYQTAHELVVLTDSYGQPAEDLQPFTGLSELQDCRVHAETGLCSHAHPHTVAYAARSVHQLRGSQAALALVYLLRIDPQKASLEQIERASSPEIAGVAAQVAMSANELGGDKIKTLAEAMNHDMNSDALLACLATIHAELVEASVLSPAVLRDCVKEVVELFGHLVPTKWNEAHASLTAAISSEIELSVAALELWVSHRCNSAPQRPVYTSLVEHAVQYVSDTLSKAQGKHKIDPATVMVQIWKIAPVLWRLSGSEAVIVAAMIHHTNQQINTEKCDQFEALRHLFSKEVAALVTELSRCQTALPDHHGSAFSPNLSQNALLIELCSRLSYFVQTGTWRMDQRRRLLSKAVANLSSLKLDNLSNAHHVLLRALKMQLHHDQLAAQLVALCLPCRVLDNPREHVGIADWPVWSSRDKWQCESQLTTGVHVERVLHVLELLRPHQPLALAKALYTAPASSNPTPDLNGAKLNPTPPASSDSKRSSASPLPPLGRASPLEKSPADEGSAQSTGPSSHLKLSTPPDKKEREHILSYNICEPTDAELGPKSPVPVPPQPQSGRRRPARPNNAGTIGQPVASQPPQSARPPSTQRPRARSRQYKSAAVDQVVQELCKQADRAVLDRLKDMAIWQQPAEVGEYLRQLNPPVLTLVLAEALYRLGVYMASSLPKRSSLLTDSLSVVVELLEGEVQTAHSEQAILLTALLEMLNLYESAPQSLELCGALMHTAGTPRPYKLARACRPRTPAEQLADSLLQEAVGRDQQLGLILLGAECDAAVLRTVGGERTAVTAAYLCQLIGANQPISMFCGGDDATHTEAVNVASEAQQIVSLFWRYTQPQAAAAAATQLMTADPASVTLALARLLRWVVKPHYDLNTLQATEQFHTFLVSTLLNCSGHFSSRPQSVLSCALLFRVNMHQQCLALLHEVRGSRVRAPNMYDTNQTLHAIATFSKGAYLAKSLEESSPFFFNAARMAATLEWVGGGDDGVAAALIASLCRDHERTLEDVEAAYLKFSHSNEHVSSLSSDVCTIAHITLAAVYNGVEATTARMHGAPNGPIAALLVLVFLLHDLCDLDAAPEEVARPSAQAAARELEHFGVGKLEYTHSLLIETIRLMLSRYGLPDAQVHPDFCPE